MLPSPFQTLDNAQQSLNDPAGASIPTPEPSDPANVPPLAAAPTPLPSLERYWDSLTPHHADMANNVKDYSGRESLMNFLTGNNLGVQEGYDALKSLPSPAASVTLPNSQLLTPDSQLQTPNSQLPETPLSPDRIGSELTPNPPQVPSYSQPALNPVQAGLMALGAVLDKRHAAQDVQGGLQGIANFDQAQYERQLQQYQLAEAQHRQQLKNLLTLAGMQSGRDEASARLQAELVARQTQIQAQEAWRNTGLQERIGNDLENRYNSSTGLQEKLRLGRQLGLKDDQIQADWGQQQQKQGLAAVSEWNKELGQFEGRYGADPIDAQRLKAQKSAFAAQFGVPESALRDPYSQESLQEMRDQVRQANWEKTFDLNKDKFAEARLRERNQIDANQQRLEMMRDRINQSENQFSQMQAIRDYNAATQRLNSLSRPYNATVQHRIDDLKLLIRDLGSDKVGAPPDRRQKDDADIARFQGEIEFWEGEKAERDLPLVDVPLPPNPLTQEPSSGSGAHSAPGSQYLTANPQGLNGAQHITPNPRNLTPDPRNLTPDTQNLTPNLRAPIPNSQHPVVLPPVGQPHQVGPTNRVPQVRFDFSDMHLPQEILNDPGVTDLVGKAMNAIQHGAKRSDVEPALRARMLQIASDKYGMITHPG